MSPSFITFSGAISACRAIGGTIGKGVEKVQQRSGHDFSKKIHKILSGFLREDPKWYKLVTSALGDIFIHYNIQFCHLLCDEQLEFSWEKVK